MHFINAIYGDCIRDHGGMNGIIVSVQR